MLEAIFLWPIKAVVYAFICAVWLLSVAVCILFFAGAVKLLYTGCLWVLNKVWGPK